MATIHVSDKLVERLQTQGVSNIEFFVEKLIQQMDDREIAAKSQHWMSAKRVDDAETTITELLSAFAEIREGLSKKELSELMEVMNSEYIKLEDPN
jgi:Ca2+-binding EF-hand superfamily protein